MRTITYEQVLRDKVVVGSPARVADRLRQLHEELGIDGILAELNFGSPHTAADDDALAASPVRTGAPAFRVGRLSAADEETLNMHEGGNGAADDDADSRWMSYAELAEARRITLSSAIRLVVRRGWRRQMDNQGTMRALVPPKWSEPAPGKDFDPGGHLRQTIEELEASVAVLRQRAEHGRAHGGDRARSRSTGRRWRAGRSTAARIFSGTGSTRFGPTSPR